MTKNELEIFKNKLVEQGYKYSSNLRIPYFWKNIVSRPDSDGDMRAVVMITYDIYDYIMFHTLTFQIVAGILKGSGHFFCGGENE